MRGRGFGGVGWLLVVVLAGCTGGPAPTGGTTGGTMIDNGSTTAIDLVVSPHPDDELEAWSLIGDDAGTFTVFLTMTDGESTVNCTPAKVTRNTQTAWGELAPEPTPQGPGTPSCKAARIGSWNAFLDSAAALDTNLPTLATMTPEDVELAGHPARLWWSAEGARIAVDGGDGSLSVDQVRRTVAEVLALRGAELPDLPVRRVIGAAYTNDPPARGDSAYAVYRHPDHWAVRDALLGLDTGVQDGVCVTTWPSDPTRDRELRLDDATYDAFTALGEEVEPGNPESLRRVGSFQRISGWLAFPQSYWPRTDLPVSDANGQPLVMAQQQTFSCR